MKSEASAELLAPIEDVWSFLSEPHNFSDWWPNIGGVQPDRRGFAEQARWTLIRGAEPGLGGGEGRDDRGPPADPHRSARGDRQ